MDGQTDGCIRPRLVCKCHQDAGVHTPDTPCRLVSITLISRLVALLSQVWIMCQAGQTGPVLLKPSKGDVFQNRRKAVLKYQVTLIASPTWQGVTS